MELLLQQVLAGLANGAIYALMALAVVMIYQAIDHLNFAQGEMATFSTFIAWQVIAWGQPYWLAFAIAVTVSFLGGIVLGTAGGRLFGTILLFLGSSRLAEKVTGGPCSSKLTPAGSPPLATSSTCWRRNWRSRAMPRSLSTRCSSEWSVMAPWPVWAVRSSMPIFC